MRSGSGAERDDGSGSGNVSTSVAVSASERRRAVRSLKAVYFNYYLGHSGVIAFLSLYLSGLGLSGHEIGVLLAVGPAVGLAVQPLWSLLADGRVGLQRALTVALVGAAAISLLLPLTGSFAALFALIFVWALFFNGIDPLLNATALEALAGRADGFGRIRLYGSFGNAASQLAVGALGQAVHAAAMFFWQAGWFLASLPLVARARIQNAGGQRPRVVTLKGLRALGANRALALFLFAAFLSQTSQVMGWSYFAVYTRSHGASAFEAGAGLWIAVVSAFPFFYFGEWLLRGFGPRRLLVASSLAYTLRWGLLSLIGSVPAVYLIQLLNGVCYGLYSISAVALVHRETPEGLKATGQGLLSAVHISLATIGGGLLGGALMEAFGVVWIYRVAALLALLSLAPLTALAWVRSPRAVATGATGAR